MGKLIDLTGQRFGRLTVVERAGSSPSKKSLWKCRCDCGREVVTWSQSLRRGQTRSCGCLHDEISSKHMKAVQERRKDILPYRNRRLYAVWCGMLRRCTNSSDTAFSYYGGRGIIVCAEWEKDYIAFQSWAFSHGYTDGLTIDRIDNDGPYSPENCRWVSMAVQGNNRRSNVNIEYKGEMYTFIQLAKAFGIHKDTLRHRILAGWTLEDALTKPVKRHNSH